MTLDPLLSQLLLAFAGAAAGAAFGAATRWSALRNERRLRLTLDLYAEFHAPAFNHIRIVAHDALVRGGPLPATYASEEGEARDAVSSVVHFWEKAALLAKAGAVDLKLMRRFLGQYARWWSDDLCANASALSDPEWGATLRDIDWLFQRLKRTDRVGSRR